MVGVRQANASDRQQIEKLISEYHASEGLTPIHKRIAWAVDEALRGSFPGLLLVAHEGNKIVGVALSVYTPSAELGRVVTVNDFFVRQAYRRLGVGRSLVKHLVKECTRIGVDEIALEVLSGNWTAAAFWRSMRLEQANRMLFKMKLGSEVSATRPCRTSSPRKLRRHLRPG